MKKIGLSLWVSYFFVSTAIFAAPRTIPLGAVAERGVDQSVEKPQMVRDLEGLDPREGNISKGLRGSFTIRHYISGPWKGGTAVIELASDSSYAEVRIFDVEGNLQRIYSIQPRSQNARLNDSQMRNPVDMVRQGTASQPAQSSEENVNITRSRSREAAVEAQTANAIQIGKDSQERSAEFIPRGRRGTVSSPAGDIREEGPAEVATPPAAESVQAAAPRKRVIRVRRKRHHKKTPKSSLDTPLSGTPEKEQQEDEYYYEDVVVIDKPKVVERPVQVARAELTTPSPASRTRSTSKQETSRAAGDLEHTSPRTTASIPGTETTAPSAASSAAYDEEGLPDVTDAVNENAAETPKTNGKNKVVAVPETKETPKAAAPEAVPNPLPVSAKPVQVVSLPGAAVQLPPLGAQESPRAQPASAVKEDLSEAQKAAAKLDSDAWTPKPSKAAPSDAELGLTDLGETKGKASGKRSSKRGNYDDIVPLSEQARRGGQVGAGDTWTPSSTNPKLSSKDEQALAMINTLKTPSQVPVARVNRDINNPEEGVKPFYSLEKYSGAQFGRHREFERRVMYKQNKATSVKGYEFYIDEVDRKQEKHYLYYYKIDSKTKKAKLIATEKHEKVTFLGNYDIGSEDKGKIDKE